MLLGNWKSYDELETNLTLEELFEMYGGMVKARHEEFKNMARANGATFDDPDDSDGQQEEQGEAFNRVMEEVRSRAGAEAPKNTKRTIGGPFVIETL